MTTPNALGLVPNEVVGFRIRTDEYNYTLVLVKRHGPTSKHAGETYDTPLSYHKKLEYAVDSMMERITRLQAEGLALDEQTNGSAWGERLVDAMNYAKAELQIALKELLADKASQG